jgi:hypothetical protein
MEHPQFGYDPLEGILLIGQPAIDIHVEAGGQSVPLSELLTNPAAAACDRKPPLRGDRDRDSLIGYGQWVLSVARQAQPNTALKTPHLVTAAALGIGPSVDIIRNRFSRKIGAYKKAVGSPVQHFRGLYRDWDVQTFVTYARTLHSEIAEREGAPRKLTLIDIAEAAAQDKGPGRNVLQSITSLSTLNENLGYPNIKSWDEEDYIAWGVRVIGNNGYISSLLTAFDTLSKLQRGPGSASITRKFGTLGSFYTLAEKRFKEEDAERRKRLDTCQQHIEPYLAYIAEGVLEPDLLHTPEPTLLAMAAKCRLITYFKDGIAKRWYPHLAGIKNPDRFIGTLVGYSEHAITPGDVESVASMLGIYDDLFTQDYSYLRVT